MNHPLGRRSHPDRLRRSGTALALALLAGCSAVPVPARTHALDAHPARSAATPALDSPGGAWQSLSFSGELQAPGMTERERRPDTRAPGPGVWAPGVPLLQGFVGAALLDRVEIDGGSVPPTDGSDDSLSQFPVIGGGAQWKLAGRHLDLGFEGMFSLGWRSGGTAFASGGGGLTVAVDVDMTLLELYGGPFVSTFLGDRLRAYAAAGPVMQWAAYDQSGPSGADGDGDGFGTGLYARTGLELVTTPDMMIGLGVRWIDSTIDLSGDLGDLDLEGLQLVLTVSRGI